MYDDIDKILNRVEKLTKKESEKEIAEIRNQTGVKLSLFTKILKIIFGGDK